MLPTKKDLKAKKDFIIAFFDGFERKALYLEELYKSGHRDEAKILCSCYIDSLAAALYWPDERNNFTYVKVLREHGGNETFSCIHPKMLDQALHRLSKRGKKWEAIYLTLSPKLQEIEKKLYSEKEIVDLLSNIMLPSGLPVIRQELWRGTFAAIIYDRFRIASVHGFGPPDETTFDGITLHGRIVPPIDFAMVNNCLKQIVNIAREISERTGKWFGHDYD